MSQSKTSEWHIWRPSIADSKEAQEWPEFVGWCEQWAGWTNRTVAVRRMQDDDDSEPKRPEWHAHVYGGQR